MGLTNKSIINLAHIMSIRTELYKAIDKIYLSNIMNYKLYEKDVILKHPALTSSTLIHEEYSKRAVCIMLSSREANEYNELLKLFKNKFPVAANYYRLNDKIDTEEFTYLFLTDNRNVNTEEKLSDNLPVLIAMSEIEGKEVFDRGDAFSNARDFLIDELSITKNYKIDSYARAPSPIKKRVDKILDMVKDKFLYDIRRFSDIWEYAEVNKINEHKLLLIRGNLNPYKTLGDKEITESDMKDMLTFYIYAGKSPNDIDAIINHIITESYILCLIKEYNAAKKFYQDTEFTTIVQTMAPPKPQKVENIKTYESEYKYGKKKLAEANKEIVQLKRQISKLKDQLEESEANKQELHSLREFVYNLSQEDEDEYEEMPIDYRTVQHIKSVIVGGRPNWQQRMKEKLPNFSFIDTDALNFDTGILDSVKTVFVNTNYISHGMYYKVASAAEKKGVKMVFLNKQNEDIVINKIYKECMMQ